MIPAKRTRLDAVARRAQLIALGVQMLAARTLDAVSVEDIARQAGISRGLLFHYFSSKQEFHTAVARAAAQELLDRTEPDIALPSVEALRGALDAFICYVEQDPDNYKSLVRGAASGDTEMRGIFEDTRATMAGRVIGVVGQLGIELGPRAQLAVHGWVAYCEECTIRWIETGSVDREALLEMLTKALPALVLASADEEIGSLASILTADSST